MRVRILAALALWACLLGHLSPAHSEPPVRSLTLQECIDLALQKNLDLQIEHLTADIAGFALNGAYGAYDPIFSFRALHEHINQPGDFDPHKVNPDFPYTMDRDTIGATLDGSVPIGLSYLVETTFGKKSAITDFNGDPDSASNFFFGVRDTNNAFADAGLAVRQHFLKDFWIDQDRATIRVRRTEMKMTEQALRFEIARTILAVELAYYELTAAREQIRVYEKALELNKQFVAETRRRVEVGDLPPLDAEQAETQLQTTLTLLSVAREALGTRQNAMKALLTDDFRSWADTEIRPADALTATPMALNRSVSFSNALAWRADLAEARLAVEKSDVNVQFRFNQLFPSLDAIARYGNQGIRYRLSDAAADTYSFHNNDYSYGVVLSSPLTKTTERNQYRASKAARQMAQLQLRKAEEAVFLEVADWVTRVDSRFSQVTSTRRARTYAEEALAAEQKKLQNELSTSFIVLQLQEILTSARTAEVLALSDYNKAVARLGFAEGSTLQALRLNVEVK